MPVHLLSVRVPHCVLVMLTAIFIPSAMGQRVKLPLVLEQMNVIMMWTAVSLRIWNALVQRVLLSLVEVSIRVIRQAIARDPIT